MARISATYFNHFSPDWPHLLDYYGLVTVPDDPRISESDLSAFGATYMRVVLPVAEAQAAPVRPLVGPPLDLRASVDAATGGARVDWSPPAQGAADGYIVSLHEIDRRGTYGAIVEVARYYTATPSVTMLPDSIEPGRAYLVRVTALAGDEIDLVRAPHHRGWRYGAADNVVGVLRRDLQPLHRVAPVCPGPI